MSERICVVCGAQIACTNRSQKCFNCKQVAKRAKQVAARRDSLDERLKIGQVILHSCLSLGSLDPAFPCCHCKKFVSFEWAKKAVESGRCLDYDTRQPYFMHRAIVEASRLKTPPISTLGSRVAIERQTELDETRLAKLKSSVAEDRRWRQIEMSQKIDLENEITCAERSTLIREYPSEDWEAIEAVQKTLPGFASAGREERSSIGIDCSGRCRVLEFEEEFDATTTITEIENDSESEPAPYCDDSNADADDSSESFEELTETREEAA